METHLRFEMMKEKDCSNVNSLRHFAIENGKITSSFGDYVVIDCGGDSKGVSLCPTTPIPRRKNGESSVVLSTPLSLESPRSSDLEGLNSTSSDEVVVVSGCEDSPRTPKEGVFNPFAPGPEDLCMAPCKKPVKENRNIVARRLDFDAVFESSRLIEDDKEEEIRLEKMLLDMVFGTLLDSIILKQTEDFLAENKDLELDDCKTPISPLPLTGISETCPEAPTKGTTRKLLNIDPGLCRKLEF